MCPACNAHNYRDKTACYRCHGPKLSMPLLPQQNLAMGMAMGMGGGMGGAMGGGTGGSMGYGMGSAQSNFRVGDWMCPSCNAHNYKSKTACFKCKLPKQQNLLNNANISALVGQLGAGGGNQQQLVNLLLGAAAAAGGRSKVPANFRPGDWMCPGCEGHNYNNKDFCFKCNAGKPKNAEANSLAMAGGVPPNFRKGDWLCGSCNAHNYQSKSSCYKCGADKSGATVGAEGEVRAPPPIKSEGKLGGEAKNTVSEVKATEKGGGEGSKGEEGKGGTKEVKEEAPTGEVAKKEREVESGAQTKNEGEVQEGHGKEASVTIPAETSGLE